MPINDKDTITFGPPSSQWTYHRPTKTFNLSPSIPTPSLCLPTTDPHKPGTSFKFDPSSAALVIIDMQNFFLDPSCMDHPNGLKAVDPTISAIRKCRELGIRILWLNWGLSHTDLSTFPANILRCFLGDLDHPPNIGLGDDLGEGKGRIFVPGTWNADIFPKLKKEMQKTDLQCAKNRMSGCWSEDGPFYKELVKGEIKTLLFAGVNTDQCVLGTLTDSYNRGFNCILLDDCCGTPTPGAREVCIYNISNAYGFVTDSKSLLAANIM